MEKIFYIEKETPPVKKAEYIKEALSKCTFKIGDKVKVNCEDSPELIIDKIDIVAIKNYELDCVFLENRITTLMFNKGSRKFESNTFSEHVLVKVIDKKNDRS